MNPPLFELLYAPMYRVRIMPTGNSRAPRIVSTDDVVLDPPHTP